MMSTVKGSFGCPLFWVMLTLTTCGAANVTAQSAPELPSGWQVKPVLLARHEIVVAAHPLAAQAGAKILANGGSAIDAAIAAQLVLNVVEPQSSGLGGGGFLLYFDAKRGRVHAYDGRESAPSAATSQLFLSDNGAPLAFVDALIGGRSVGVPGLTAMLELAHRRHGRNRWPSLFIDAIATAEGGFPITVRLSRQIAADRWLANDDQARAVFYDGTGQPLAAGMILRNAPLAETLRVIAKMGSVAIHDGEIGAAIIARVKGHAGNPGLLTSDDLRVYRAIERPALCALYRSYRICAMGPPSSGGLAVLQILKLLEDRPMASLESTSLMAAHLFAEASRLAYADRGQYVADPAFVPVPIAQLLNPGYLRERAAMIDPRRSLGQSSAQSPGQTPRQVPPGRVSLDPMKSSGWSVPGASFEMPATTHLSVIDRDGNVAVLTSSIESAFGARIMAAGLLLNNQLTDFSFTLERDGELVANRVQAGKRPRSSMSPIIVFDLRNRPILALGSPGGPWIISYVARALLGVLDQQLSLQAAVERAHVANRNGLTELERGTAAESLAAGLVLLGHDVRVIDMTSGLHGIERTANGRLRSGVDPRRDGAARGR